MKQSPSIIPLLLLLFLTFLTHEALSLRIKGHYTTSLYSSPFIQVAKFGAEEKATIAAKITHKPIHESNYNNNTYINVYICDDSKFQVFSQAQILSQECDHLRDFDRCFFSGLSNGTLIVNVKVHSDSIYHILIANCERLELDISIQGELLNPGLSHLDTGTIPLLVIYPVMAGVWFVLLVMCSLNGLVHRQYARIPLHWGIIATALLKILILIGAMYFYWHTMSEQGETSITVTVLYYGAQGVWVIVLYTMFLLIAKGWCITRPSLTLPELLSIALMVSITASNYLLSQAYSDLYVYSYGIVFTITLKYIFSSLSYNVVSLENQLDLVDEFQLQNRLREDEDQDAHLRTNRTINTKPVIEKIKLFKRVQVIMVVYLFISIIKIVAEKFFFAYDQWISIMAEEILQALAGVSLGFLLRLRKFELRNNAAEENRAEQDTDPNHKVNEELRSSKQMMMKLKLPPLVILQNPPTIYRGKSKEKGQESQIVPSVQFASMTHVRLFSDNKDN